MRFTREAYAAAQLVHHNVVQVYDIGADHGINWFSMEFIDGTSLGELLASKGRIDPRTAAGYILQATRGLQFAHERGMVHRDIKPDNLMLNKQGIVKVADLGLVRTPGAAHVAPAAVAKHSEPRRSKSAPSGSLASMSGMTLVTQTMGTPSYMAPEQTRSAITVDERADIYSLGCTLYTLITGRTVFQARTAQEMMLRHQHDPVVPPQTYVKTVPKALSDIILKMLAKDPAARYQTTPRWCGCSRTSWALALTPAPSSLRRKRRRWRGASPRFAPSRRRGFGRRCWPAARCCAASPA